jgi:hypothetical protein
MFLPNLPLLPINNPASIALNLCFERDFDADYEMMHGFDICYFDGIAWVVKLCKSLV